MINASYILNSISVMNQTTNGEEPCITYLWFTFLRVLLMTTGYLLKALQIYVFAVVSEKLIEELKNSVQEDVKTINQLQQSSESTGPEPAVIPIPTESEKKGCSSIDDIIREREYIGSKDFLVKAFFVINAICLVIPFVLNVSQEVYYHPFNYCGDRTLGDIVGLIIPILARNGIKAQIVGIVIMWVIVVLITLLAFSIDGPIMDGIWKVFSPASLLLPFWFGTIVPLFKTYKSGGFSSTQSTETASTVADTGLSIEGTQGSSRGSSNDTGGEGGNSKKRSRVRGLNDLKAKMNFYSLIHYVNEEKKAVGFDSIYSFCIQLDVASGNQDYYCRNALLFVRDYDIKKKELDAETVEKQTKQFTSVLILYQKYLADGQADIDNGRTARSPVIVDEEALKKLQAALSECMKKDDYSSEVPSEILAGIYENTMKETIAIIYKSYVLSNYFEAFMKQFNADQRLRTLAMENV
eukprot:CAMPEP_0168570160 /NCGR_PEP_ID=MMETSP0413-20121227/16569_1 /TAXON_ID=136452 /ORGANISM="Filamoeba nolandi, Strain NC-AS-23-1" /LENGTH=466 /DNA_ID=CAMNT_0008602757 /DNA_START=79 /DNA_END=1476 /DNA_ORIENTATION=+